MIETSDVLFHFDFFSVYLVFNYRIFSSWEFNLFGKVWRNSFSLCVFWKERTGFMLWVVLEMHSKLVNYDFFWEIYKIPVGASFKKWWCSAGNQNVVYMKLIGTNFLQLLTINYAENNFTKRPLFISKKFSFCKYL